MALSELDDLARSAQPEGNDQSTVVAVLAEQVRHLGAQAQQQQAEITALRAEVTRLRSDAQIGVTAGKDVGKPRARPARPKRGSASSRRALLKWSGAAAAAATVALVASEGQGAHAKPANDGDAITAGQTTTASSPTALHNNTSTSPNPLLLLDNTYPGSTGTCLQAFSASGASAVYGSAFGSGTGVWGNSSSGNGVYGQTTGTNVAAVQGDSAVGSLYAVGVLGITDIGNGVSGTASGVNGTGVNGASNQYVDIAARGTGRVYQKPQGSAGAPTGSNYYNTGEAIRDSNGELWLCLTSGNPGLWVRAVHAVYGYVGGAISYLPKPIRLLDTRGSDPNAQHNGGGPIAAGPPYTLQIANVNWQSVPVPINAVGAIGKLTVISGASGSGFVALVPSGSGTPTTGTLPYGANQTVATSFNVGLGGSPGAIDIYVGGTAVDVVIDLFAVVA